MKSFALNTKSASASARIAQRPQLSCAHAVIPARTVALAPCSAPITLVNPSRLVASRALADINVQGVIEAKEKGYTPRTTPSQQALDIWKNVDAVCFDVDCTVTVNDSLDLLAEFLGCGAAVEELTNKAMNGTVSLQESLEQRLEIINCSPADIKRFLAAHPPKDRLAPGIEELIRTLQARGVAVYLITGGFREIMMPVANYLGVPKDHCFANRMNWQWDEETGAPTKLVGFDVSEPTARNKGKVEAIKVIRNRNPYNNIVMIGDGITDLEAVQSTHGADLFIGYGGVIERPDVASKAEWFVYDFSILTNLLPRLRVACVGSGAWACAALRMVAQNTWVDDPADEFVDEVKMWVHEAEVDGRKLTDIINETHENVAYLPGIDLGSNIVALSSLEETVKDADCIILCAPHQYVHGICKQLVGKVKPGAIVCSLTKGMRVKPDGPQLISSMVSRYLNADCSVLMGANIAGDVAKEQLGEGVIGYNNLANAKIWKKLFARPYFMVNLTPDVVGAEMCGTLKNIVALGAGMVDGLGYGSNSKSAILRQGLQEMRELAKALYPTVRDDTFFQTCGMGDLIATCYGGRNRLVAEEWTKRQLEGKDDTFEQLETELLAGQKLQGVLTSDEVQEILKMRKWEDKFPLFTTINRIINGNLPPSWILRYEEGATIDLGSLCGSLESDDDIIPVHKPTPHTKKKVAAPVLAAPPENKKLRPTPPPVGKGQVPNKAAQEAVKELLAAK